MAMHTVNVYRVYENRNQVWDPGTQMWVAMTQPGGGSGGAVTIANGADVAEGSTTDAAWDGIAGSATVVAILKKIATGTGGGGAVTIADAADVAEGATTDVAVQGDNPGTVSAKLRGLNKSIAAGIPVTNGNLDVALSTRLAEATFTARINTQGQKTMAGSTPVVLPSDQPAIDVTAGGLSRTTSGVLTNVNDFLQIDTTGMNVLTGYALTNDTTNRYGMLGSIDGTNFYYTITPLFTPTPTSFLVDPAAAELNVANFVSTSISPQFTVNVAGLVAVKFIRTVGSGSAQTWVLAVSPATPAPGGVTLIGKNGHPVVIDANGLLSVDASGKTLTIQGEVTDPNFGTNHFMPTGDLYNDAAPVLAAPPQLAINRITPYRAKHVNLRDAAGNELGTAASPLAVKVSPTDWTPSAPTTTSVGVASGSAVAANANRKGLIVRNLSTARISLGFGSAAVLDSGVTLYPQDGYQMGAFDFDVGVVNAIASAAASNLAIQEYA